MFKRLFTPVILLCLTALILGACSSGEEKDVVATVNGEEISKADYETELENTKATYAQQGINLDDFDEKQMEELETSILDQLINTKLVLQTSADEGIAIEQTEIDTELEGIKSQFEDDKQFEEALAETNLTEEKLEKQVREQLTVSEYFKSEIGEITVSEEEVKTFYDQYKKQLEGQEQEVPEFETIQPQLEQQATAQKKNEKVSELLEELRKVNEKNIEILL
jgi:hypothetical protein